MHRKVRILFCHLSSSLFIKRDLKILQRHFHVRVPEFGMRLGVRAFLRHVFRYLTTLDKNKSTLSFKLPALNLLRCLLWADLTFSWFAEADSFRAVLLSKIFRKKSIVVVGGCGVANVPEIGYGSMLNLRGARKVRFVLENADIVLPFSNFAKKEVLSITRKANLDVMPLGCDTEKFKPAREGKENIVLTVCIVKKSNIARKGLETFIESARFLPDIRFILIGPHKDDSISYLRKISPSNIEFTGYVSDKELIRWYQRAKVYCQLSYQEGEGAGGALGEAMACECVPVVSLKAAALRETVGDCGFYVPYGDAESTAEAIKATLRTAPEFGKRARKRMKSLFSMRKREENLLHSIDAIMKL